jgi:hypothetical protein
MARPKSCRSSLPLLLSQQGPQSFLGREQIGIGANRDRWRRVVSLSLLSVFRRGLFIPRLRMGLAPTGEFASGAVGSIIETP